MRIFQGLEPGEIDLEKRGVGAMMKYDGVKGFFGRWELWMVI